MLSQVEWGVQNEAIPKNRILALTTLFFGKYCFILRTFRKELI